MHVRCKRADDDVLGEHVVRAGLVVRVAGGDLERGVHDPEVDQFLLDLLGLGEPDADAGLVGRGRAVRVVVEVAEQVLACRQQAGGSGRELVGSGAGSPGVDPGVLDLAVRGRAPEDEVVEDLPVAGLNLDGPDPAIFLEAGLDRKHGELVGPVRRDLERIELVDPVRFAEGPLTGACRRLVDGFVSVAARSAVAGPAGDRLDLHVAQGDVVGEGPEARVGVPGWHVAVLDRPGDRARPGAHLAVGAERHRRDLVRLMAGSAVLVEDRRDVVDERGLVQVQGLARRGSGEQRDGGDHGCAAERGDPVHIQVLESGLKRVRGNTAATGCVYN